MELRKIAGGCPDDDCPTVYLSDRGTVVFQGNAVTCGIKLGAGEQAVELPLAVVREALPKLSEAVECR
ncbi:hypothetical protein HNR02_001276 [Amycolatopsis endophytica]|uniref:Uncharacterized protein n=1 Tax=Amycolatopsis endophytica TaxID=860233 RepID=A0A853AYU6_9PSEU|nr:hypothetical protein [Amycolatopsis endophytica]NYI87953.1 hypothetical protein [Amycolatopsis endophytica]